MNENRIKLESPWFPDQLLDVTFIREIPKDAKFQYSSGIDAAHIKVFATPDGVQYLEDYDDRYPNDRFFKLNAPIKLPE